jgi:hypothetical protein
MAFALPDWGFTIQGTRYTLNPSPWLSKEQLFATIIFSGASTIGNFTGLLVMRLPIFFNQRWADFGFAIVLALANQIFGLGMAAILRRLTVYPQEAVWPSTLPTIALNRTLINSDNKRETVNGWEITRYVCFMIFAGFFLIYYWIQTNSSEPSVCSAGWPGSPPAPRTLPSSPVLTVAWASIHGLAGIPMSPVLLP